MKSRRPHVRFGRKSLSDGAGYPTSVLGASDMLPQFVRGSLTDKGITYDLFNPNRQSFPASVAECAAAGFAGTVQAGWACQEASGTTLADFSGNGYTLTAGGSPLVGQPAVGLFNGASFRAQKAIETTIASPTDYVEVASSATLDKDWTAAWSVLLLVRFPRADAAEAVELTSKGTAWEITCHATTGVVTVSVNDGAGHTQTTTVAGNLRDGGWHWIYARFDPVTSDVVMVDTDLTTGGSASTAAITTLTSAAKFRIGASAGTNSASMQVRGLIVFSDVLTTVASIQSWWVAGNAPSWMTYTRASTFNSIVADDTTTGDVLSTYGSGKIAYEYNSLISTNALKLGMASYPACANLLPGSNMNVTADWVNTTAGTGATALYDHDSPRGFREAIKHTKVAAADMNLTAAAKGAAVTSGSVYTASVWCCWAGASTAPELQVYRADGTTLIGSVSATNATSLWRRISYTFTAPATETVRVAVMGAAAATLAGSAWFACPQVNTEDWAKPWVMTTAATAATAAIVPYATVDAMTSDFGTLKVWCTVTSTAADKAVAAITSTAGGSGRQRQLRIVTANSVGLYAGSSIVLGSAATDINTVESIMSCFWDVLARYGYNKRIARLPATASGAPVTGNTALDAVGTDTFLNIGHVIAVNHLGGCISKIRVWRGVEIGA